LERTDKSLLAAFLVAATLGTLTQCLLFNDGAIFIAAGWLGDAWDLNFRQFTDRALGMYMLFGPAQAILAVLPMSASAFVALSHVLYFAIPLALWLVLRAIEPHRLFSRLYLAGVLALLFFPTELIVASGFWMICLSLATDARRSTPLVSAVTVLLGAALIFTHPATALMSAVYLVAALGLRFFGKPVPQRSLVVMAALAVVLFSGYFVTSKTLLPSNPTIAASIAASGPMYVNVPWLVASVARFAGTGALWVLLVWPGLLGPIRPVFLVPLAIGGLWFAASGTNLLTYMVARYSAAYVLPLAAVLAIAMPDRWLKGAQRCLTLAAAIGATAAVSYSVDLFLFGRFVDQRMSTAIVNVETMAEPWPRTLRPYRNTSVAHMAFKWGAGPDYARDVVVPTYDWYRLTLAFYSYFRSSRAGVLFHPANGPGEWLPFEAEAVKRAAATARDDADRQFLEFIGEHYAVPGR
jgi:hypothetical protein